MRVPTSLRLGAEYTIVSYKSTAFSIRGGIRASRDVQSLFGGFGVNIGGLQLDYAIQDGMAIEINGVGSTHYGFPLLHVLKEIIYENR